MSNFNYFRQQRVLLLGTFIWWTIALTAQGDDQGNTTSSATTILLNNGYSGTIDYAGDVDFFRIQVGSSGTLTAYTLGGTDTYGSLLDSNGATLATNDDNPYPNFSISFSVSPGTYYIRIRHYSGAGTGSYTFYTEFREGSENQGGIIVPLPYALDNSGLSWSTSGNGIWFGQTGNYFHGAAAAQSSAISHGESTTLQTTVTGPGTLSFLWCVSSEACCDPLTFSIDGVYQTSIRGEQGWTPCSYKLSSGQHTLRWTYSTDGSNLGGSNAGWVDYVQFIATPPPPPASNQTPDLLFRHPDYGLNAIWFMSNDQLLRSDYILPDVVPDLDWNMVGAGDFNSDGHPDIVWQHRTAGLIGVWFMNGRAKIGVAMMNPSQANDLSWCIVGVGDFNRDGKPDLLWQHRQTGDIAIWHMDGVNLSSAVLTTPSNPGDVYWQIVGVGDFNSDGWPDIVWQHLSWDYVAVWLMSGGSLSSSNFTNPNSPYDVDWDIVDTGDFDRDGRADLLWQHRSTGQIAIWFMNYLDMLWPTFTSPSIPDPWNWQVRVVSDFSSAAVDSDNDLMPDAWELQYFGNLAQVSAGDYDADGVSNLQEFRQGSDPTVNFDSDGDGLLDSWEIQHFGNLSENGAGDFDGDGITNLVEFQARSNASGDLGLLVFTPLRN
jgi:hypothetical protein